MGHGFERPRAGARSEPCLTAEEIQSISFFTSTEQARRTASPWVSSNPDTFGDDRSNIGRVFGFLRHQYLRRRFASDSVGAPTRSHSRSCRVPKNGRAWQRTHRFLLPAKSAHGTQIPCRYRPLCSAVISAVARPTVLGFFYDFLSLFTVRASDQKVTRFSLYDRDKVPRLPCPMIRSPSQCPKVARVSTSVGRVSILR